ncbi:MAG: stimulus-sensing domain-containing protein [Pseudomonadota bacterium]
MASDTALRRREPRLTAVDTERNADTIIGPAERPSVTADPREEIDRHPSASLTRRILAINLVPLALFLAGVLYLDNYREGLIAEKVNSLTTNGELIAGALGETVVAFGLDDVSAPPVTQILEEDARALIRRLVQSAGIRARLFGADGALIADSRQLVGTGGAVHREYLPPPGDLDSFERLLRRLDRIALGVSSVWQTNEPYSERADQTAYDYPEVVHALNGMGDEALRDAGRGGLILTVAVPVSHFKQVQGALLLSSDLGDVERELRAVRSDILALALLSFGLTVLMSLYLAGTIARPVRKLALAAEKVGRGTGKAGSIPDFASRGDEIGELSRALIDMTRTLENRMMATERFAADVAHEIKNPLSSLKSALETIQRIEDPERRAKLMAIAADDLNRLDRLITDISDASRLDAELNRADTEKVDIGATLQALAMVMQTTWGDDGPRVDLNDALSGADVAGRFVVRGVEDRLVQVFRNLLVNARSFSPPDGTVRIAARQDGRWVEITVSDQGPGIPAGKENDIFNRFYSDRPPGEKFGTHSGLGLSISRQIIEAHHGTITASNLGSNPASPDGACFTVRLLTGT